MDLFERAYRDHVWAAVDYKPYDLQMQAHEDPRPVIQAVGGVRAGKSKALAMECAARMHRPGGTYWIVGPDYAQARAEFNYVHAAMEACGFIRKVSVPAKGPCTLLTHWDALLETKTSDDIRKIASFAVDFVGMAEAAQHPYDVYLKLLERSLEKRAPIWMTGTFETSLSWYADFYEQYVNKIGGFVGVYSWPTWANTEIFPLGFNDPAIQLMREQMDEDLFWERCGAVPVKPSGLVHRFYDPRVHVQRLQYNASYPVELAIDPGYDGAYAVLFLQPTPKAVHVLDEVYERHMLAREVIAKAKSRPLWNKARAGVIDVAGLQHHATDSQLEIWERYAPGVALRYQPVSIEDGINVVNLYLKPASKFAEPRLYFNETLSQARDNRGLPQGILGEFIMRKRPQYREGQAERTKPIKAHDHACNALGYWLFDYNGPILSRPPVAMAVDRGGWVN